eukprot:TRINITY_DN5761_c0_g1_i2.p1 TRINITY_DN5761_c0_g1~~TRINITY_DN5761_c0_g1_i2.p1  ORF type:complete len:225 (-),score=43.65 TRINITY_DN5761_c0_g1_i2:101-775(-)
MEYLAQQAGGRGSEALAVTIAVVAMTAVVFCFRGQPRVDDITRKGEGSSRKGEKIEEEQDEKIKGSVADFEKHLPADRIFSLETLAPWDGRQLPMCIGVCGKVLDVSSSENFEPGFGYGKLWAGKDATYALAHASLKAEDANVLDYDLTNWEERPFKGVCKAYMSSSEAVLNATHVKESTMEALGSWCKHFLSKYPVVGALKEYDGQDFSQVLPDIETEKTQKS